MTGRGMPAIFFRYELSPIRIQYTMSLQALTEFLVRVCAIVGGIYAVSSIIESLIRNSMSIFAMGSPEDDINRGASGRKRVVRKVKEHQPVA